MRTRDVVRSLMVRLLTALGVMLALALALSGSSHKVRADTAGYGSVTLGANWSGNATNVVTSVASLMGLTASPGYGQCYVAVTNMTNTPVSTGYHSTAIPLTATNGTFVCNDPAVCVTNHYVRDATSLSLSLVAGVAAVAVKIEIGGGCL